MNKNKHRENQKDKLMNENKNHAFPRFSPSDTLTNTCILPLPPQEHIPELWQHFQEQGVEVHMFASQWFLTLYTAKFPLFMVFHYLDLFLLIGLDSVFQVALALLQVRRQC